LLYVLEFRVKGGVRFEGGGGLALVGPALVLPWVKGDDMRGFAVEGYRRFEGRVGGVPTFIVRV
jgi:hypothetical protein